MASCFVYELHRLLKSSHFYKRLFSIYNQFSENKMKFLRHLAYMQGRQSVLESGRSKWGQGILGFIVYKPTASPKNLSIHVRTL